MKTHRILAMLLALIMLLSLAPASVFAATDNSQCRHVWGQVDGADPTCTQNGFTLYRCRSCGSEYREEIPALGHDWGPWKQTAAPGCVTEGSREHVCNRCGIKEVEAIPPLGHSWAGWVTTVEPTCTLPGEREHRCSRCGLTTVDQLPALGHDWGEWHVVIEPTLNMPGLEQRVCKRCNLIEERELPPLAPYADYALALVMDPAPSSSDWLEYGAVKLGLSSYYIATVANIGSGTVWVQGYTVTGTGGGGEKLASPVMLYPGESMSAGVVFQHHEKSIDKTGASGDYVGALSYSVSFYGSSESGGGGESVSSNSVDYRFRVLDHSDSTTWDVPDEGDVTIVKELSHGSSDPEGFQLGETIGYTLLVTNVGSDTIYNLAIYDPLTNGSGSPVLVYPEMPAGAMYLIVVDHVVTLEDVQAHYVMNAAYAEWANAAGETQHRDSNIVVAPVINKTDVLLVKSVVGDPDNGAYYVEGETVHFDVYVKNSAPEHFTNFKIYDSRVPGELLTTISDLGPGEDGHYAVDYTVTEMDTYLGWVVNDAWAMGFDKDGNERYYTSNEVVVPTAMWPTGWEEEDPFGVIWGLDITKTETSTPKNGEYYKAGEEISYKITVTNNGELPIVEGIVYDILKGDSFGEIGSVQHFGPGESRSYTFSYTVTKADVKAGTVVNYAYCFFDMEEDGPYYAESNTVVSRTNEKGEGEEQPPFTGLGDGKTSCVRSLTGRGEMAATYALDYCPTHSKLAAQCLKLVEEAESKNEAAIVDAWTQVRGLWTEALDKEYETLYAAASASAKAAVTADRNCFYAYVDTVVKLLGDEDAVLTAKTAAEMVMNRCADLCYDIHHAGSARPDSLEAKHEAISESMDYDNCVHMPMEADEKGQRYAEIYCVGHRDTDAAIRAIVAQASSPTAKAAAWKRAQKLLQVAMDEIVNADYKAADKEGKAIIAQNRVGFDKLVATRSELMSLLYPQAAAMESVAHLFSDYLIDVCSRNK